MLSCPDTGRPSSHFTTFVAQGKKRKVNEEDFTDDMAIRAKPSFSKVPDQISILQPPSTQSDTSFERTNPTSKMNILIYLSLFVAFALALPTPQGQEPCKALIETSPWQISNIVVFNNLPTAPTGSSIHFHVSDKNPGLEFEIECGVSLPQGTGARPEEAQGWHPCDNDQVRFLYQPGNLQIRRSYIDDW